MKTRSTYTLHSVIPKTHFCSLSEWTPKLWEVRLHRWHLSYIQRWGFLRDGKNCTVCIKLYWLQIKMLSWKPPSSDSKEGQLEFSLKCIKFSTKCYTNKISFFPPCLYSYSNLKASNHEKKTRNLCRETLHWLTDTLTTQGHHWHHHFLSTREDFFCIFSIHI